MTARHTTRRARRILRRAGHPELQHLIELGTRDQSFSLRPDQSWSAVETAMRILAPAFPDEVCLVCLEDPAYRVYYEHAGPYMGRPECMHLAGS